MNILIKKLRKNCSKIAAMAVISAVVVVIILVSRVRVDANNSYGSCLLYTSPSPRDTR